MELTTTTAEVITCAKPDCGNTTVAGSYYIDGCGTVCRTCFGPIQEHGYREPPF
jgi:hypothetical protein